MTQRGLQSYKDWLWQRQQYADGVADGLAGRRGTYSDQYYQKGYRRGTARRAKTMTRKQEIRNKCEELAKETAKKIGMRAWYDEADNVLTPKEKAEIKVLWDTMSSHTCWNDAFLRWMET